MYRSPEERKADRDKIFDDAFLGALDAFGMVFVTIDAARAPTAFHDEYRLAKETFDRAYKGMREYEGW